MRIVEVVTDAEQMLKAATVVPIELSNVDGFLISSWTRRPKEGAPAANPTRDKRMEAGWG